MPFKLSEETADKLLDKLGSDDAFRVQFQADPRQAMAAVGHEAAAKAKDGDEGLWSCCQVSQLASKEAIQASRAELKQQLVSANAAFKPVSLEVGKPKG